MVPPIYLDLEDQYIHIGSCALFTLSKCVSDAQQFLHVQILRENKTNNLIANLKNRPRDIALQPIIDARREYQVVSADNLARLVTISDSRKKD